MATNTAAASLTNSVNAIRSKAILTMQDYGVFPAVFERKSMENGTRSFTEPKIATVDAYDLTDGVDMTNGQILGDSLLTITPAEVGVQILVTRLAQMTKSENFEDLAHRVITDALKKAQDVDGTEQLDGFSVSLGSGSSTTMTRGYAGAARARIAGNSTEPFPKDPLTCVIHPYTFNDLLDSAAEGVTSGTPAGIYLQGVAGVPEEAWRKYAVGSVAGMPILTDGNIAISSNAAKGGIFSKRAVYYVEMWGIEIEPEKDSSARLTELNGTMCYAYGKALDYAGVELNLGATAPTS